MDHRLVKKLRVTVPNLLRRAPAKSAKRSFAVPPPHPFLANDGQTLPVWSWLPKLCDIEHVLIALHGNNDYSKAFQGVGEHLARQGISVFAYDQRGFGDTAQRGVWPGADQLIDDALKFLRFMRAHFPLARFSIMGESIGASVWLAALADTPDLDIHRIILVAPAVWGWNAMWFMQRAALLTVAHSTAPNAHTTGVGLAFHASNNAKILREMALDPLVIKTVGVDNLFGLLALMQRSLQDARRIRYPSMLTLYGMRDAIIPRDSIRELLSALPADQGHRVILYDEGWHWLLRDVQAESVWQDIAAWISETDPILDKTKTPMEACAALST